MNFGLRLDEILSYERDIEGCQASHSGSKCLHCNEDPCPHCKRWGGRQRTEVKSMVDDKTKQALTSLIKELVAEARTDELKHLVNDDGVWHQDMTRKFPQKIRLEERIKELEKFEQNLLKEKEEV